MPVGNVKWARVLLLVLLTCLTMGVSAQTLRNASNSYIGRIDDDGTVRNSSNMYIGKMGSDGTVRNSSNSYIGRVESDGTIRNSSNMYIGSARGVKREWAAVFFFFNLL